MEVVFLKRGLQLNQNLTPHPQILGNGEIKYLNKTSHFLMQIEINQGKNPLIYYIIDLISNGAVIEISQKN